MKLKEVIASLDLEVLAGPDLEREVKGGYIGDLLSNVMARAQEGELWLTIQGHQNVIAVAHLTGVAAVIVVEGFDLEAGVIQKAEEKGINLLRSPLTAYELAARLHQLGIN